MSGYVPNPLDITNPTDATIAETAQAEFRALKAAGLLRVAAGTSQFSVVNSTSTATPVSLTVPAGILAIANKEIEFTVKGTIYNNTGTTRNVFLGLYYGPNVFAQPVLSLPTNAQAYAFKLVSNIQSGFPTVIQFAFTEIDLYYATSGPANVSSQLASYPVGNYNTNISTDFTVAQALQMQITLDLASTAFAFNTYGAKIDYR